MSGLVLPLKLPKYYRVCFILLEDLNPSDMIAPSVFLHRFSSCVYNIFYHNCVPYTHIRNYFPQLFDYKHITKIPTRSLATMLYNPSIKSQTEPEGKI